MAAPLGRRDDGAPGDDGVADAQALRGRHAVAPGHGGGVQAHGLVDDGVEMREVLEGLGVARVDAPELGVDALCVRGVPG